MAAGERLRAEGVQRRQLRAQLFFFQAEDGIRDLQGDWSSDVCSSDLTRACTAVTLGISTLALAEHLGVQPLGLDLWLFREKLLAIAAPSPGRMSPAAALSIRSEERRVGKECRSRWSPYH